MQVPEGAVVRTEDRSAVFIPLTRDLDGSRAVLTARYKDRAVRERALSGAEQVTPDRFDGARSVHLRVPDLVGTQVRVVEEGLKIVIVPAELPDCALIEAPIEHVARMEDDGVYTDDLECVLFRFPEPHRIHDRGTIVGSPGPSTMGFCGVCVERFLGRLVGHAALLRHPHDLKDRWAKRDGKGPGVHANA